MKRSSENRENFVSGKAKKVNSYGSNRGYEYSNEYDNGNYSNQYDRGNYRSGYNAYDYGHSYNPNYNNDYDDRNRYNDEYSQSRNRYNDYEDDYTNDYESRYLNDNAGRRYRDTSASQYQGRNTSPSKNRSYNSSEGRYRNNNERENYDSQGAYGKNRGSDIYRTGFQGKYHSNDYANTAFSRHSSPGEYDGRNDTGTWHGYDATARGRHRDTVDGERNVGYNGRNRYYYEY